MCISFVIALSSVQCHELSPADLPVMLTAHTQAHAETLAYRLRIDGVALVSIRKLNYSFCANAFRRHAILLII